MAPVKRVVEGLGEHRIPAVERAVAVLETIERAARPPSIREISTALAIPRSTAYRILNSLEAGGLLVRTSDAAYRLGPAILRMARMVPRGFDVVGLAGPVLENVAAALRLSAKLSILDDTSALVVAVAMAPGAYAVTTQVGRRFPLHAGAASKMLAAHLPEADLARLLIPPLARLTAATVVDPTRLRTELAEARRRGWARDNGEHNDGVCAIAAPVFDAEGTCVAALSVPFVSGLDDGAIEQILTTVRHGASTLSRSLGWSAPIA
jgi:DNA-binding IclR family transcriptional regulator